MTEKKKGWGPYNNITQIHKALLKRRGGPTVPRSTRRGGLTLDRLYVKQRVKHWNGWLRLGSLENY